MKQFIHPVSCTMTTWEAQPAKLRISINLSAALSSDLPVPAVCADIIHEKGIFSSAEEPLRKL